MSERKVEADARMFMQQAVNQLPELVLESMNFIRMGSFTITWRRGI